MAVRGKTLRLFTDFYNSDLIIASPLSLKQIEDRQGFDYLSSVELAVVYGGDMMCMQNYDHLHCVLANSNATIKKDRNTDISRLREYFMNDMQKYMRQTVFVNCVLNSNLLALFHRSCFNPIVSASPPPHPQGRLELRPLYEGSVSDIIVTSDAWSEK